MNEFVERAQNLHQTLGDELAGIGGLLRCLTCGREEPLGNVGSNLRHGWPKCHGYTMQWITQRQLDEAATAT